MDKKLELLAGRLYDLDSLRRLFEELNFEFSDEPVSKLGWTEEEKNAVSESHVAAKKFSYRIYYIKTRENNIKHLKTIAAKIIKNDIGLCLVCSHSPNDFRWVFSILSDNSSASFNEARHVPLEICQSARIPRRFIELLDGIRVPKKSSTAALQAQIANAFDGYSRATVRVIKEILRDPDGD